MANTKGRSAAQRREQERQQRKRRLDAAQSPETQKRSKRARKRQSDNNPWPLVGGILVMVALVIGIFFWMSRQPAAGSTPQDAANTLKIATSINATELERVGVGSAQNLMKGLPPDTPVPNGPTSNGNGKPMIFYQGADFCPYCASQRWSIIVALSRFGTFGPLNPIHSSENNVPSYSFNGSTYTSQYVNFVPLETADNEGKPLQKPTAEQQKLIDTYNAPPYAQSAGSIPFMMYGNKWVSTGSYFQPQDLIGLSYQEIGNRLQDPNSPLAQEVLGGANLITAAVCSLTNNQPENVCNTGTIQQIQKTLPTATTDPSTPQVASINQFDRALRRQDIA